MINFFYELVRKLKRDNKPYWKYVYKMNKVLINCLFPVIQFWRTDWGIDENSRIIVSLTTYPARINSVWLAVASLLQQTMKPYKVILWLAEEQFVEKELPARFEKLKRRGLEIRFCEDLKPHKKYYSVMNEYPEYYVITADDDILYPENHIEKLWKDHEKFSNAIICNWSHQITFDGMGFVPYDDWCDETGTIPMHTVLAVGCNGVLYPPESLPSEAFVKEKIIRYALYADDLWLKCMEILNGKKVVNCNESPLIYFGVLSAKRFGLWKNNTGYGGSNDVIWESLMDVYPEVRRRLWEEQSFLSK